jgi:hypothetical protein
MTVACGGGKFSSAANGDAAVSPDVAVPVEAGAIADAGGGKDGGGRPRGRVTVGLVALWEMEEKDGDVLFDTAGQSPAADLTLQNAAATRRSGGVVRFQGTAAPFPRAVATAGVARIVGACNAANQATLELWIEDETTPDWQPALSLASGDFTSHSLVVEVEPGGYSALIATGGSTDWLNTSVATTRRLTHVVHMRDAAGLRRTFVDGVLRGSASTPGAFALSATHVLSIGGSGDGERGVRATMHMVALYARALGDAEVKQNFDAGADP